MQTQRIVLSTFTLPLLAMLYGCQPGDAPQEGKTAVPAVPAVPAVQQQASGNGAVASVVSKEVFVKLAKDIGCFACHSIEKKLLGPAWKDVAVIYRQDPEAENKIMNKVAKGGSGVWGTIAMPGYPNLEEEKRRILVRYILALE